jgi:glycosyltransferase involved in cell wall biosynthesis
VNNNNKILSVCLITYNHRQYIRKAIDSILSQTVSFSWELVVADDFSTDGTREILIEYQKKYPDLIKLILQTENVGPQKNWIDLMTYSKSKYIAYIEGDDYWISNDKLERQVSVLEKENISLSFHNAWIVDSSGEKIKEFNKKCRKTIHGIKDVFRKWVIPSSSIVFKNVFLDKPIPSFLLKTHHQDLGLFIYLSEYGKFYCIDEKMCAYRKHENSITSLNFHGIEHNDNHIVFLKSVKEIYPNLSLLVNRQLSHYYISNSNLCFYKGNIRQGRQFLFLAIMANPLIIIGNIKRIIISVIALLFPTLIMRDR